LTSVVAALAVVIVLGWPALATVLEAIRYGDAGPVGGWARPLDLARESFRLVCATEALALPLGVLLAFLLFRTDLFGRKVLLGLMVLGALVPMPLHAIGWLGAIGNVGRAQFFVSRPLLTGWRGAAFVNAMGALPWVVLLAGVGLRSVETELEDAARLDLPAWRVVVQITLRRAIGGILAAWLMVAVLTSGDMTVTDLLVVRTYAEEAYLQEALGKGPAAMAIVTVPPLLVLGIAVLLGAWALLSLEPSRLPSPAARPRDWRLGRWRVPVGISLMLSIGVALVVPIGGMVWRAGRLGGSAARGIAPSWSFEHLLGSLARATRAVAPYLGESALNAALGATASLAFAWLLAWLARRPGAWRWVVACGVALALATPAPVAGMSLVLAYRRVPGVYGELPILLLAYVLRTFAFALALIWVVLRVLPETYFEAAAVEGASGATIARRVALPLTGGALGVAWLVAFLLALGELPASKLVESPGMRILSTFVWGLLHTGVDSQLAAVGLVLLAAFGTGGALVVGLLMALRWGRSWS
jgi:iron(III) transport system permease protein